jgi:hypothetical protein
MKNILLAISVAFYGSLAAQTISMSTITTAGDYSKGENGVSMS